MEISFVFFMLLALSAGTRYAHVRRKRRTLYTDYIAVAESLGLKRIEGAREDAEHATRHQTNLRFIGDLYGRQTLVEFVVEDLSNEALCVVNVHLAYNQSALATLEVQAVDSLVRSTSEARLEVGEGALHGPLLHVMRAAFPKAWRDAELHGMTQAGMSRWEPQFTHEPLSYLAIRKDKPWVSLSRVVLEGTEREGRQHDPGQGYQRYLRGLIAQTHRVASDMMWTAPSHADFWYDAYIHAPQSTKVREQALQWLLTRYRGTRAAERAWSYALNQSGALYDVLFLINNFQGRAVHEISDQRLIEFINKILESRRFDTSALPTIAASRFDFDVVLGQGPRALAWEVREALVRLWLAAIEDDSFTPVLSQLLYSDGARREHILHLIADAGTLGAAEPLAVLAKPSSQEKLSQRQRRALARAMRGIAQKHPETVVPKLEAAAINLLDVERADPDARVVSDAIATLAGIGEVAALRRLAELRGASSQTLAGAGREARLAHETVLRRLKRRPQSGGVTLLEAQGRVGGLSVSAGKVGALQLAPAKGDE
ncbi:MAG: hypothetical protein AAGI01_06320 [Myxococcota bacterium]